MKMWGKGLFEYEINNETTTFVIASPLIRGNRKLVTVIIIIFSTTIIVILTVKLRIIAQWAGLVSRLSFLKIVIYPLGILTALLFLGLLLRTLFWLKYRPLTESDVGQIDWPFISVIMPAYNESEFILKAIDSVFRADYPRDKLEVIAVDDGSEDDTWEKLKIARENYGHSLRIIHFNRNLGKRKALYSGLKLARGEIIITVDSDSLIEPAALKKIIIPLLKEPEVGAVAGRVAGLNERENILTRMLSVNYSLSFDFGRAYQSVYGGVMVCPGALTAYRMSAIRPVLREWANQVFMGKPCTHGEDRHLTTLILKNGYATRYQANAIVYTQIPADFVEFNKMYIRWTRSGLRESLILLKYLIFDFKHKRKFISASDFFLLNIIYPFHLLLSATIIFSLLFDPMFVLRQIIFLALVSLLISLHYFFNERSLSFIYGVSYTLMAILFLWWIIPYSLLTLNEPSWLTR